MIVECIELEHWCNIFEYFFQFMSNTSDEKTFETHDSNSTTHDSDSTTHDKIIDE